ncbi:MAG: gfo/Idh/MocA family oxidoreductase, partial [Planctomycetes bacterium]|nr:gfo/Idh/MocA family oxidoreductase [Planctomycetota bacterium]
QWADLPDTNHYQEWCTAIRESRQPSTPFGYAGPLTETVLLGNVAYRSGKKIEWDAKRQKITNTRDADKFVDLVRRKGWELG